MGCNAIRVEKIASITYHRAMNVNFHGLISRTIEVYISGIVIKFKQEQQYVHHIKVALEETEIL